MNKYMLILAVGCLLAGCRTLPAKDVSSIEKRLDNLEAEVIALRAENHALASYVGLYDEEYPDADEKLDDLEIAFREYTKK